MRVAVVVVCVLALLATANALDISKIRKNRAHGAAFPAEPPTTDAKYGTWQALKKLTLPGASLGPPTVDLDAAESTIDSYVSAITSKFTYKTRWGYSSEKLLETSLNHPADFTRTPAVNPDTDMGILLKGLVDGWFRAADVEAKIFQDSTKRMAEDPKSGTAVKIGATQRDGKYYALYRTYAGAAASGVPSPNGDTMVFLFGSTPDGNYVPEFTTIAQIFLTETCTNIFKLGVDVKNPFHNDIPSQSNTGAVVKNGNLIQAIQGAVKAAIEYVYKVRPKSDTESLTPSPFITCQFTPKKAPPKPRKVPSF